MKTANTFIFSKTCPYCQSINSLSLNREDWNKYLTGSHYIQNVFVDLSPAERELIMTGICSTCWDSFFSGEEDDPYDDNYDPHEYGVED